MGHAPERSDCEQLLAVWPTPAKLPWTEVAGVPWLALGVTVPSVAGGVASVAGDDESVAAAAFPLPPLPPLPLGGGTRMPNSGAI